MGLALFVIRFRYSARSAHELPWGLTFVVLRSLGERVMEGITGASSLKLKRFDTPMHLQRPSASTPRTHQCCNNGSHRCCYCMVKSVSLARPEVIWPPNAFEKRVTTSRMNQSMSHPPIVPCTEVQRTTVVPTQRGEQVSR